MKRVDYMIFSDASVGSNKSYVGEKVCACSVIVLNVATNRYSVLTEFLGLQTINFGELYGIYRGLQILNTVTKDSDRKFNIAVVSDSKTSITTLSDYVHLWDKTDVVWKRTNGNYVKNQSLIQFIYDRFIDNPKYSVRFIHMNSHKSYGDINQISKYLKRNYHIKLDDRTVRTFIDLNSLVDKMATTARKTQTPIKGCTKLQRKKNAV